MYAARLATALKQRSTSQSSHGPGPRAAAGVEIIADYSEVSVVGITEVLKRLHRYSAPCAISLTKPSAAALLSRF